MKSLDESELRLMQENEKLRTELEQIKSLLNKTVPCEQLSTVGSLKLLCDNYNNTLRSLYCSKDEFKKLQKLVNEKDYHQAKERLQTILNNWDKLFLGK